MPVAIGVPIFIGWVSTDRGASRILPISLTFFAISNVIILSILIWITAIRLNRSDAVVREGERRYRDLIESLPQLVWTSSADGLAITRPQWVAYTSIPEGGNWVMAGWSRFTRMTGSEPSPVGKPLRK